MNTPIVYLAGAIAGTEGNEAFNWREVASLRLRERNVECLSPMRAKTALRAAGRISRDFHDYEHNGPLFTSNGIMTRDSTDVRRCDALLVNLRGLTKPSLGTVMELGWAYILNKPAVVVIEPTGNPHDNHPMIHETMSFRVESLEDGIDLVASVLGR